MGIFERVGLAYKRTFKSVGPFSSPQERIGFANRLKIAALKAADLIAVPFKPEGCRLENLRHSVIESKSDIDLFRELEQLQHDAHDLEHLALKTLNETSKSFQIEIGVIRGELTILEREQSGNDARPQDSKLKN